MPTCENDECKKQATFDIKDGKGIFCTRHKTAEMTDVKNKSCELCGLQPAFNIVGQKPAFCSKHKTDEMINVKSKKCEYNGCNIINPVFNIKDSKTGKFCVTHKEEGMIDVKTKRCKYKGCDSMNPGFNISGSKTGKLCATHKEDGMVNVINKKCEYQGCNIISPVFNIKDSKTDKFCTTHKEDGMVNVKSKRCELCEKIPNFDIKGGKGRFCATHKQKGMVDVKHISCELCEKRPTFDIKGGKGRFCATHKQEGMIDVKHTLCELCEKRAYYGKPGHQISHCFQHREKGMIRKPNAKCSNCKELAIWGTNWTPKHCEIHKTEDDENLVERECISCNLLYVLDKTNKCENCNPESFLTARLAKQNALMDYLDALGLKGASTDTTVDGGICGKERPDRVYDFGDKFVILECDEDQHKQRACLCEQTRMINIGQTFGGIPVYFIRWNPDNYCPESDKKNPEILAKRHKLCGDLINDIKNNKVKLPKALVSAIYLYYDEWSSLADEEWKVLSRFE